MTRFGDFSKFLSTNFPLKEAQIFSDHFGFLKTVDFEVITAVATFWQLLDIFGLLFIPTSGHTDYRQFFCRKKNEDIELKTN